MFGFRFFGIEIAIGIEIDLIKSIDCTIFSHTIASSTRSTEHRCHAIQLDLSHPIISTMHARHTSIHKQLRTAA
ncbi:MAG TPA: hypothetical protein PLM29_12255 [Deltaproteobacteria bacterium]|nr:hypothetical protein [Deltaproteobacteria bacterium]